MSIASWKFCPRCAGPLALLAVPDRHVACASCGFSQYENPLPTTVVLPTDGAGRVLLVRRSQAPRKGLWDTLGGFLDVDERAEECARREMREETGIDLHDFRYIGSYPSTYGETGRKTLGFAFECALPLGTEVKLSDENAEWAWFALDALPELAFKDGDDSLADLKALRNSMPSGD